MKLLVIGTDRKLFEEGSPVRERLSAQAELVEAIHVIVFAKRQMHFVQTAVHDRLHLYPTNSRTRLHYLWDTFRIGRTILRERGEWVVSAQDPFECGLVAYILAKFSRAALHVQLHTDPFSNTWKDLGMLNQLRSVVALLLLRRAHAVRVVSVRAERGVLAGGVDASRVTRVPIYVDVGKYLFAERAFDVHEAYPDYRRIILSAGRLEKEKDFATLLRAFAQLRKTYDDALLLIVGSGSEEERLRSLAEWLNVTDHVHFLPWSHDLISYYKSADLYVQPSQYEGWGMSIIEAMASGIPVVTTDVGCAGEVAVHDVSAIVVPPGDADALRDGMMRVLGSTDVAGALVSGARVAVERLATKAETMQLYKQSWETAWNNYAKEQRSRGT